MQDVRGLEIESRTRWKHGGTGFSHDNDGYATLYLIYWLSMIGFGTVVYEAFANIFDKQGQLLQDMLHTGQRERW